MSCSRLVLFIFFFSSRRRHTRSTRDWSSDVCSSDLCCVAKTSFVIARARGHARAMTKLVFATQQVDPDHPTLGAAADRSEERRVGKSVDLGGGRRIRKENREQQGDS